MKRRNALKMVATSVGGLIALPSWATGWTPESLLASASGPRADTSLLAEVVETILPATPSGTAAAGDVPGAKALGVHEFVQRVVDDCFGKPEQEAFQKGLASLDGASQTAVGKSFLETTPAQRLAVLTAMSQSTDPVQKNFLSTVKNLTIRGYMSTEYVMNNITHYEMVPGRYKGCVPVKK